jgi:hypothetical protein
MEDKRTRGYNVDLEIDAPTFTKRPREIIHEVAWTIGRTDRIRTCDLYHPKVAL